MSTVVVFAFAAEEQAGSRDLDRHVLARQIPRLLVLALNGSGDRGVRFLPFLGMHEGERRFLEPTERLPAEFLLRLAPRALAPRLLVDGLLGAERIHCRVLEVASGKACASFEVPFVQERPLAVLGRLAFEVAGALGWQGAPPPPPPEPAPGAALALLAARDELLAREASLVRAGSGQAVALATRLAHLAPEHPLARETVLDLVARLGAEAGAGATLAAAIQAVCGPSAPAAVRARGATLLLALGETGAAHALFAAVHAAEPADTQAALHLAAAHHAAGDEAAAAAVLLAARGAGNRDPLVAAQLVAAAGPRLEAGQRATLLGELARESDLPAPAARFLAAHLVAEGRGAQALAVIDRSLVHEPRSPGLWLEKGRACLLLDHAEDARAAFLACLDLRPPQSLRAEAVRLARFCARPGLLRELHALEADLAADRHDDALRRARRLVRAHPDVGECWLFLGILRQRRAQLWRAERALRRAVALVPDLGEAHNRLGVVLLARRRYREGYEVLHTAVAKAPELAGPRLHLAQACRFLGRVDEGLEVLAEAERRGGDPAKAAAVRELLRGR
ncbi:MAG: tetratricopeptide repeat protein [Planctomycetes bacterium]|nr:tetratricopeptide repeat protein [Planctomycetota bacterium]